MKYYYLFLILHCFFSLSCSNQPDPAGAAAVERIEQGDTTIVRYLSDVGTWDAPMELVEELSIGVLEGAEELMFGRVSEIAVDASGGIYVFDGQVPALRYFDADGNYVRTQGGEGQGPGEYQDAALGLVMRSDGRLVMRDPRNSRLNVYNPDGSYSDSWPVQSGLFTAQATFIDQKDHLYLKILEGRPERNKPWPISLLHLDEKGAIVDTIPPPPIDNDPEGMGWQFEPQKVWTWSPLGYMVSGVSSTYAFSLFYPDGKMLRIERAYEPVAVHPEERAELEAQNDWRRKTQGQHLTSEIPPVPLVKPAYSSLMVDDDGRIWVRLHQAAVKNEPEDEPARDPERPPPITWSEPVVYDVYQPDGTYLGQVHPPKGQSLNVIRGDTLWGTKRGDLGEQYVVRMRMQPKVAA